MNLEIIAITFDFLGKILIAITALLVHRRVKRERRIDKRVLKEMRLEQGIGIIAIILIVIGYVLHIYTY
jgi:hypothetical protein